MKLIDSYKYSIVVLAVSIFLTLVLNRHSNRRDMLKLVAIVTILYLIVESLDNLVASSYVAKLCKRYEALEAHVLGLLKIFSRIGFCEAVLLTFLNIVLSIVSLNPLASEFIVSIFYINPLEKFVDPLTCAVLIALSVMQMLLLIFHAILDILLLYSYVKQLPILALPLLGNSRSKSIGLVLTTIYTCIIVCCIAIGAVHLPTIENNVSWLGSHACTNISRLLDLYSYSPENYKVVLLESFCSVPTLVKCNDIIIPCPGQGPLIVRKNVTIRGLFSNCTAYVMWRRVSASIDFIFVNKYNISVVKMYVKSGLRSYNSHSVKYVYSIVKIVNATIQSQSLTSGSIAMILRRGTEGSSLVSVSLVLLGPRLVIPKLPDNCTAELRIRYVSAEGVDAVTSLIRYYQQLLQYANTRLVITSINVPQRVPVWYVYVRCMTPSKFIQITLLLLGGVSWSTPQINNTALPVYSDNVRALKVAQILNNFTQRVLRIMGSFHFTSFIPITLLLLLISSLAAAGAFIVLSGMIVDEPRLTRFLIEFVHSLVYDYVLVLYLKIISKFSVRKLVRLIGKALSREKFTVTILGSSSPLESVYKKLLRAYYIRSVARSGKLGIKKVYESLSRVHSRETLEDLCNVPRRIYVDVRHNHNVRKTWKVDDAVRRLAALQDKPLLKTAMYYSLSTARELNILKLSLTMRRTPSRIILELLDQDILRLTLLRIRRENCTLYEKLHDFLKHEDYRDYSALLYRYEIIVYKLTGRKLTFGQMYTFLLREIGEFRKVLGPADRYVIRRLREYLDIHAVRTLLKEYTKTLQQISRNGSRSVRLEFSKVKFLSRLYNIRVRLKFDESSAG